MFLYLEWAKLRLFAGSTNSSRGKKEFLHVFTDNPVKRLDCFALQTGHFGIKGMDIFLTFITLKQQAVERSGAYSQRIEPMAVGEIEAMPAVLLCSLRLAAETVDNPGHLRRESPIGGPQ